MSEEPSLDFVCKTLAKLFEFPCDIPSVKEVLHNNDKALKWCETYCGKAPAAECWEYYFRLKFAERRKGNGKI